MKKSFAISILAAAISTQSFALEKNIDFYNNKSIISYEGKLNEFKNIKFDNNILYIDNIKKDSFIRLNGQTGELYTYSQNNSLYDIFRNHLGENVVFKNASPSEQNLPNQYKIFRVEEPFIVLEKDNSYQYVNELTSFRIPAEWLNLTNGYEIKYKNKIEDNNIIFYSYDEESLQSKNKYEIILDKDNKFLLTHFIEIENSGKPHENVNISFFHGDMNIKDTGRTYSKFMRANVAEMSAVADNAFNETSIANIKVVELKDVILNSGSNKFKYKEKQFDYKEYVNITNEYVLNNPVHKDVKPIDLTPQISFNNYIEFEVKDDILPQGEIKVYDNNKLIISDNLNYSEKQNVSILKNTNKDLKIENVEFTDVDKDLKNIKSIEVFNNSTKIYEFKFNDKVYILEANKKTKITLN